MHRNSNFFKLFEQEEQSPKADVGGGQDKEENIHLNQVNLHGVLCPLSRFYLM